MVSVITFQKWLKSNGRSPNTVTQYGYHVERALEGSWKRYVLNGSPATQRVKKAALKSYAKYSKDHQLLGQLSEIKLDPLSRVSDRPPLSHEELLAFREALDEAPMPKPVRAVLGLMATRGFRVGDALRLSRPEVSKGLRTGVLVFVAKGRKRLHWPIKKFKKYLELLIQFRAWDHVYELISPDAVNQEKAARTVVQKELKYLAEELGIDPRDMYTHRFRRTIATLFLEQPGASLPKLQKYFGWSNINVAANYADWYDAEELEDLAEGI